MSRVLTLLTNAFPVWVVALSAVALAQPAWFAWFSGPWITWGLAVIMLGMGLTLTFDDFRGIGRMPKAVALGQVGRIVAAQGAADQRRPPQLGDGRFKLGNGLARMVVQRRHPQAPGKPQAGHEGAELARLVRRG